MPNRGVRANAKQPSSIDRHVGARLRAMRKARALSQAELGNALGVSAMQVQKYERGQDRIGAGSLFDVARMLGVKVSAFFEGLV
ncbi:MAG TPA: helix-turn-helix transcriptional regulator [Rhizomicrobium sp.]|jgi:transcriptional regulator with XRE-family HTH domain|nr:helix-turn-helix transcriptional regulator [Rhizomicrobium sp.]